MGNAEFKQLQIGEGTSALVLHIVLVFFSLLGLNLKRSRCIVQEASRPQCIDSSYCLHGLFIPALFAYGK